MARLRQCALAQGPENSEGSVAELIRKKGHALTATEVAEILNVSRGLIYRLAASGRLPYLRVGGAIRFDPEAVIAWLRTG